ncbi:MAG: hypothetical protein HY660_16865 [Armatimonadetes bacterium]|nr:hypothetical protein [Armatimonadota bacterium]
MRYAVALILIATALLVGTVGAGFAGNGGSASAPAQESVGQAAIPAGGGTFVGIPVATTVRTFAGAADTDPDNKRSVAR